MPWLLAKSHDTDLSMNTRIKKTVYFAGLTTVAISLLAVTPSAYAEQTSKKKPVKIEKDQFQLTLSTVPYTADPNAAFVRNYCELDKKKKKPGS